MKPNQIFECENTVGIWDKEAQEFQEGICTAMSAVWCRNMLQGVRDLLSKPDYTLASTLQAKYEIVHQSDYDAFLTGMAMKVLSTRTWNGIPNLLSNLAKTNGQYMLRYPGHAMGAKIGDGAYYFFDPEEGLFKYNTSGDFETGLMKLYSSKFGKDWTARQVSI
jgi:hypothetical protein